MRLISQDGLMDYPYEKSFLEWNKNHNKTYSLWVRLDGDKKLFAVYSNTANVECVQTKLRSAFRKGQMFFRFPADDEVN